MKLKEKLILHLTISILITLMSRLLVLILMAILNQLRNKIMVATINQIMILVVGMIVLLDQLLHLIGGTAMAVMMSLITMTVHDQDQRDLILINANVHNVRAMIDHLDLAVIVAILIDRLCQYR